MDMLLKLLILLLLVENQMESKLMLFSLPTTPSLLLPEPLRLDQPIKRLLPISLRHVKHMVSTQFKVFFPTKPKSI